VKPKPFEELSVAIIGDIKHSRVARSDVAGFADIGLSRYSRDCTKYFIASWFSVNMVIMFVYLIKWMKALKTVM
jgi:hypothetical protein